jgi:hypothetical protein
MIDGTGAGPVEHAAVVIAGERILYAGPREAIELPGTAEIIDVSGHTILPGFINAHVHRGLTVHNLEAWARAGVTTVRDLGSGESSVAAFRALYPPEPHRARVVAAGPLITVPNGYPIVPFGSSWTAIVTSVESARETSDLLVVAGDPISDLEALRQVALVVHDGVVIRDEQPADRTLSPRRVIARVGG